MANHCLNEVEVQGTTQNVNAFKNWWKEYLIDKYDDINSLLELPVFEQEKRKDVYEVVGTRWIDTNDFDFESNSKEEFYFSCSSAWSPFNSLLSVLASKFNVNIKNNYEESGNDFGGVFEVLNGVESDNCYSYKEYIANHYDDEMLYSYLENEISYLLIEELEIFKDRLDEKVYTNYLKKIKKI